MKVLSTLFILGVVVSSLNIANASQTDERIENVFLDSYVYKTYLQEDNIDISSKDGIVTLTGEVSNDNDKSLAEKTAEGLPGVLQVQNKIQVKGKNPSEYSDPWLALKIKSALLFHRSVSAVKTHVEVNEGVATLTGTVGSQAEKDLAGEYAQDIEGIKSVKNNLTIDVPQEKQTLRDDIDDASITAQVKMALLAHRSTSAIRTGVKTDNGVVTITGEAKTQAEKDLVSKLVNDTKGVKRVNNLMNVVS